MVNNYKLKYCITLLAITGSLTLLTSFKYKHTEEKPESSILAFYHFFHVRDTTNTGQIWEEDFMLASNSKKSSYFSYSKIKQDSLIKIRLQQSRKSDGNPINMGTVIRTTSGTIYIDHNKKELIVQKSLDNENYLIKSAVPIIDWKIEPETKQLLGYTCQKATGKCMGRVYTAWFTTDIPEGSGPWKLQGLPGLILEAYDIHHRIKFTCTKVEMKTELPKYASVDHSTQALLTTQKEYERMEKVYQEGIYGDVSSIDETMVDKVTVNGGSKENRKKKISVNNPIEVDQ